MKTRPERWTRKYCVALFHLRGTSMEICPKDMSPTLCCYCCPETTCDCHCKGSSPTKCPYRVNSVVYLGKKLKGPQKELVINAYTPNNSGEKDGVSK